MLRVADASEVHRKQEGEYFQRVRKIRQALPKSNVGSPVRDGYRANRPIRGKRV
jgi:hypothetical protein